MTGEDAADLLLTCKLGVLESPGKIGRVCGRKEVLAGPAGKIPVAAASDVVRPAVDHIGSLLPACIFSQQICAVRLANISDRAGDLGQLPVDGIPLADSEDKAVQRGELFQPVKIEHRRPYSGRTCNRWARWQRRFFNE